MSPRGPLQVDPDDLSPETLAKVKGRARNVVNGIQVGEGAPLLAARGAQAARKRQRVGSSLEQELAMVHRLYELQKRATMEPAHVPTKVVGADPRKGALRVAIGDAAVDYYGTAKVGGKSRSVYFDLKSFGGATYVHDPEQLHQLEELLKRRAFGALTFLLIICAPLKLGYLVEDEAAIRALRHGQELLLRTPKYFGKGSGRRAANDPNGFDHLVPYFLAGDARDLLVAQDVPRWDWLSRLETLVTEGK